MALLGDQYREAYLDLYKLRENSTDELSIKRAHAAYDSVGHILRLLGNDKPRTIIDVGAGDGAVLERIDNSGLGHAVTALEISESGVERIKRRSLKKITEARVFDGYHIPYPDQSFDLAISIHVLEHVEHERMFLSELRRVAKRIILEVPLENGFRVKRAIKLGRPHGHINFYTPDTFLNLLETSGLKVKASFVTASSPAYERYLSGKWKGLVKNLIRRGTLTVAPTLSAWMFNYVLAVYCERQ